IAIRILLILSSLKLFITTITKRLYKDNLKNKIKRIGEPILFYLFHYKYRTIGMFRYFVTNTTCYKLFKRTNASVTNDNHIDVIVCCIINYFLRWPAN